MTSVATKIPVPVDAELALDRLLQLNPAQRQAIIERLRYSVVADDQDA